MYVPQATVAQDSTHNQINLPAPTAGFKLKVCFKAVGDGTATHTIKISSTGANMKGNHVSKGGALAGTNVTSCTSITRSEVALNALIGDFIDFWSDGTSYYFYAYSSGAATPWSTA